MKSNIDTTVEYDQMCSALRPLGGRCAHPLYQIRSDISITVTGSKQHIANGGTFLSCVWVAIFMMAIGHSALGIDINGVFNASLDQPRINAALRLPGQTGPLIGTAIDLFGNPYTTFNIQAFYDTGASGVLLSNETASVLGVPLFPDITFEDVGVGGSEAFSVSSDVHVHLASFTATQTGIDDPAQFNAVYNQAFGPLRTQVNPNPAGGLLPIPLDVFGMPLFANKTVAMDARPVNQVIGTIDTTVYDSGTPMPGVPQADRTIQMSYADFSRFTRTYSTDSQGNQTPVDPELFGPTLADNPFIGSNPVAPTGTQVGSNSNPGVTLTHGDLSTTGSWLFDTGAAASMLSLSGAAEVGVQYRSGFGPGSPTPMLESTIDGTLIPNQFTLTVGGIGGSVNSAGFFADSLVVPTIEGDPLRYLPAPVLVADITVVDPITLEQVTLDGIFGMNFLVATLFVDGMTFGELRAGAFDWIVFDQNTGELGLTFDPLLIPEPSCFLILFFAVAAQVRKRRTLLSNSLHC